MNELDAIIEIRKGKRLNDFDSEDITTLMKIAAIANHENGCMEIQKEQWDTASARMAVSKDFRNIQVVDKKNELFCAPEFALWASKLTVKDFKEYSEILNNALEYDTKQRVVRDNPASRRFLVNDKKIKRAPATNKNRSVNRKGLEELPINEEYDMSSIDEEYGVYTLDATSFLKADISKQSMQWLEAIINADILFPSYFLETLILPNKKYIAFKKSGNVEAAEYWKGKIIPYLTKELCENIAMQHPEAAITIPSFLTKESIERYKEKKKSTLSKSEMTKYFLKFPAEFLDVKMAKDVIINLDILNHAPDIFAGTDIAFKYISRHPKQIFDADEKYQLEGLLLSGAVVLDEDNVKKIKNDELREKIQLALNI